MRDPLVVILMGQPGAGKGTQSNLLEEKLHLFHLETSEVIEARLRHVDENDFAIINGKKYFLWEEKKLRESGKLMSAPLVAFWMEERIKEFANAGRGIVLSGSPRSVFEAGRITPLFKKLYGKENIKIIFIKISQEETIRRNSHRRTCELMRHSILYLKETKSLTKCPLDGSELRLRKDDTPEKIKIRLKEYRKTTFPVAEYLKSKGLKIKRINGEQPVVNVFADILKILGVDYNTMRNGRWE